MSKRAEEAAENIGYIGISYRDIKIFKEGVKAGYEHGEKETIDRAAEWFRTHWREYIMGPDADGCVGFGHWENDFKKAMEEE